MISACGGRVQKKAPKANTKRITYGKPYVVKGVKYYRIQSVSQFKQRGIASWYGKYWHGRLTANGERYDMNAKTAAHKTLPLGSMVHVKNLDNGKTAVVRINDRGPFIRGRIIDMSYWGAKKIGIVDTGTANVQLTLLSEHQNKLVMKGSDVDIDKGNFQIQIASFGNKANAQRMKNKFNNAIIITSEKNGKPLYRVRVTGFKSRSTAEGRKEDLNDTYPGAFIVAE